MMTVFVGVGVAVRMIVGDAVGVTVREGLGLGDVETAGLMVRVNVFDAVVPAVAVTVTEAEPAVVGVPLIVPAELIESPAGSPLAA
jgi:hypothetical protein